MMTSRKFHVFSFLLCLLIVALPGCAIKSGGWSRTTSATIPSVHLWGYLYEYGGEEKGFATYTYVLSGRDASHPATQERYWALINAIRSSTADVEELPTHASKSWFNLFLIPVGSDRKDSNDPLLNQKLSLHLLTALSMALPGKFDNPGPYLITLTKPIEYGQKDEIADFLYLDLSNKNRKAMRAYVNAYKARFQRKKLGREKLASLHTSLLGLFFDIEDSLDFGRIAFGVTSTNSSSAI